MKVYLAENYSVICHQIVDLPLKFAESAVHTVEFWVVPASNHATSLGIPFLHKFSPSINWKNHTIIW